MRIFIFFTLITMVVGYPKWFQDYKIDNHKRYSKEEEHRAFHVLSEKMSIVRNHNYHGLKLKLNVGIINVPLSPIYSIKKSAISLRVKINFFFFKSLNNLVMSL